MPNDAQDIAVARYVREVGLAKAEQVTAAMQAQAAALEQGQTLSLAEALVRAQVLTADQKEVVEKKAASRQGVRQLSNFRLLKKIGEGGMGAVYLGEHVVHGHRVAIKILPPRFADDPVFLKRFHREAEAASELRHENIVSAYQVGEDLGYHFYVMEFCEGETLDTYLKRKGSFPPPQALRICLQAARGLKAAHDGGFIHRDIKPANIIVTREGRAKLLDLGLAKNLADTATSFRTESGAVLGTPHYMAPEQAQGEKGLDHRADLYALGATLYHLVTGSAPYSGATPLEIMYKHVHEQLPNPQDVSEDIPDGVVHVVRKMMAKDPADRYADSAELVRDLEEVSQGKPPVTRVVDSARSAVALIRRRTAPRRPPTVRRTVVREGPPATVWLLVGGLVAAATFAAVFMMMGGEEDAPKVSGKPPVPARSRPAPKEAPPSPPASVPEPQRPAERLPSRTVSLLDAVDPDKDVLVGRWIQEGSGLACVRAEKACARIPFRPPDEYDFRVTFTVQSGVLEVVQFLVWDGNLFSWKMGGWKNSIFGFDRVDGRSASDNRTTIFRNPCLEPGRMYVSTVKVRKGSVEAYLDSKLICRWKPEYGALSRDDSWGMPDMGTLGIGANNTAVTFSRIEVLEYTGEGRVERPEPPAPSPPPSRLPSVSSNDGWEVIFDGTSVDWLRHPDTWRLVEGALVQVPGSVDNGQTRREFRDGTVRIRFETGGSSWISFAMRQGNTGAEMVVLDKNRIREIGKGTHELVITCREDSVRATLNGKAAEVTRRGVAKMGSLQFGAADPGFRLRSIHFREIGSPGGDWRSVFNGTSMDPFTSEAEREGWFLQNGAITHAGGRGVPNLQTSEVFGDGEVRIRFTVRNVATLKFDARQGRNGRDRVYLEDREEIQPFEGRINELLFRWVGGAPSASINGRPVALFQKSPHPTGTLRFDFTGESLRILSIDHRKTDR